MSNEKPTYSSSSQMAHNNEDLYDRWMLRHDKSDEISINSEYSQISEFVPDLPKIATKKMSGIIEIPVANSFAMGIVEIADSDFQNFKWGIANHGGIRTSKCGTSYSLARMVLARKLGRQLRNNEYVDFINKNNHDCRRSNLRVATFNQVRQHRRKPKQNTTGYKGVVFNKPRKHYQARIYKDGKCICLGVFDDPYDAYVAYCKAAAKYHGDFACLE